MKKKGRKIKRRQIPRVVSRVQTGDRRMLAAARRRGSISPGTDDPSRSYLRKKGTAQRRLDNHRKRAEQSLRQEVNSRRGSTTNYNPHALDFYEDHPKGGEAQDRIDATVAMNREQATRETPEYLKEILEDEKKSKQKSVRKGERKIKRIGYQKELGPVVEETPEEMATIEQPTAQEETQEELDRIAQEATELATSLEEELAKAVIEAERAIQDAEQAERELEEELEEELQAALGAEQAQAEEVDKELQAALGAEPAQADEVETALAEPEQARGAAIGAQDYGDDLDAIIGPGVEAIFDQTMDDGLSEKQKLEEDNKIVAVKKVVKQIAENFDPSKNKDVEQDLEQTEKLITELNKENDINGAYTAEISAMEVVLNGLLDQQAQEKAQAAAAKEKVLKALNTFKATKEGSKEELLAAKNTLDKLNELNDLTGGYRNEFTEIEGVLCDVIAKDLLEGSIDPAEVAKSADSELADPQRKYGFLQETPGIQEPQNPQELELKDEIVTQIGKLQDLIKQEKEKKIEFRFDMKGQKESAQLIEVLERGVQAYQDQVAELELGNDLDEKFITQLNDRYNQFTKLKPVLSVPEQYLKNSHFDHVLREKYENPVVKEMKEQLGRAEMALAEKQVNIKKIRNPFVKRKERKHLDKLRKPIDFYTFELNNLEKIEPPKEKNLEEFLNQKCTGYSDIYNQLFDNDGREKKPNMFSKWKNKILPKGLRRVENLTALERAKQFLDLYQEQLTALQQQKPEIQQDATNSTVGKQPSELEMVEPTINKLFDPRRRSSVHNQSPRGASLRSQVRPGASGPRM